MNAVRGALQMRRGATVCVELGEEVDRDEARAGRKPASGQVSDPGSGAESQG